MGLWSTYPQQTLPSANCKVPSGVSDVFCDGACVHIDEISLHTDVADSRASFEFGEARPGYHLGLGLKLALQTDIPQAHCLQT